MRPALPVLAAVALISAAALPARAQDAPVPAPGARAEALLTVTGEGRASAVPDRAAITLGILAEGQGAGEAMERLSEAAQAVIERLAADGVAERDIQTGQILLQPRYSRPREGEAPTIEGYEARNTLSLRVPNLDQLVARLDAALSAGANGLDGFVLEVSDPDAALTQAREDAVADALGKADILARAAGMQVGRVVSITEGGAMPPPRPMAARMEMAADMPVAAGETEFTASVTLVVAMSPGG